MEGAERLFILSPFCSTRSLFTAPIKSSVWQYLQDAAGDVGGYLGVGRVFVALSLRRQPVLQAGLPESH